MASEKVLNLIEEVKGLSVLELHEMVKALEEEFGVSAAAMAAPVAGGAAPALSLIHIFIGKKDGRVVLNELNTLPGFTDKSMYPKMWIQAGLSYGELLDRLIVLSMEKTANEKQSHRRV